MAGPHRRPAHPLKVSETMLKDLQERPEQFYSRSSARYRRIEQAHPDRPRLGESRQAADDPVRIVQRPHLHFAPTEVAAFHTEDTPVARLEQHGFGVFGPRRLPLHLTELAYARGLQTDDPTFGAFINAFQHRFALPVLSRLGGYEIPATSFDRTGTDPVS